MKKIPRNPFVLASKVLRRCVDYAEVQLGYRLVSDVPTASPTLPTPLPRIALVKQEVYQDLYCCPRGSTPRDIIFSSHKRTGPVGLFSKLGADFWIVKTEPDPECEIWKEKVTDCKHAPLEYYESLKTRPFLDGKYGHKLVPGELAVSVNDVSWDDYDIVISMDISVPARVTRRHPRVVWCYIMGEPCMRSWQRSKREPIEGYDVFLTQWIRHFPVLPGLAAHEIECPQFLQYYGCFHDLLGLAPQETQRSGTFLEVLTGLKLTKEQYRQLEAFGPVRRTDGMTEDIVRGLMQSKYFIRCGGQRKLQGQAMIEAVAAGCLAIGNPWEFQMKSLFTPGTSIYSFEGLLKKLARFESDPALFEREVGRQRQLLNHLCFTRPLTDLFRRAQAIREARGSRVQTVVSSAQT